MARKSSDKSASASGNGDGTDRNPPKPSKKAKPRKAVKSAKEDIVSNGAAPAEIVSLDSYVEKAYLNYSMYVILDRALPQLADGLKPVQRRIVYAMSELGLRSGAKYKKSARTIGDVIGKFHPHGDTACYEAMVLMAQDFNTRYCMVDGQGNWGSVDNAKSFAAMRYTEARLTSYAQLLLRELNRDTTEWQTNFDGTLEEPKILPAAVPNVIINGASGIAVGMTTEIPAHNLSEVIDACLLLLDKPKLSEHLMMNDAVLAKTAGAAQSTEGAKKTEKTRDEGASISPRKFASANLKAIKQITKLMPAPDFASGGVLLAKEEELSDIYLRGTGAIKVRCYYETEGSKLVITELPPQVSTYRLVEQIQAQVQAKKLPMLADMVDESDDINPVRLVLETKRGTDKERFMAHLFATTDLEKNVRVNINAIGLDGKPQIWSINELLYQWLGYRRSCIIKRLENDLSKINARLHIMEGLMIVYLNLDEVIRIIREKDDPKAELMKKFKLSDEQTEAILETRLRNLAKLEEEKIIGEQEDLTDKKYLIETQLKDPAKVTALMKNELEDIKKDWSDDKRRTRIVNDVAVQAESFKQDQIISKENATLVLSQMGWVRLARGHDINPAAMSYREGDEFLCSWQGNNNQMAVFIDSSGRAYSLKAYELPAARGLGEPISSRLEIADGAAIQAGLLVNDKDEFLLASRDGYGFTMPASEMVVIRKKGKQAMRVKNNAGVTQPCLVPGSGASAGAGAAPNIMSDAMLSIAPDAAPDIVSNVALGAVPKDGESQGYRVALMTQEKRLLIIDSDSIPQLAKGGKGVKLIGLGKKDYLKQTAIIPANQNLVITYADGGAGGDGAAKDANNRGADNQRGKQTAKKTKTGDKAEIILDQKQMLKYTANRGTKGKLIKIKGIDNLRLETRHPTIT